MDFRDTWVCKVISALALFFFTFTYAGGREVAYAASAKDKPAAAQAATPKAPKSNSALMDETLSNLRDKLKSDKLTPREAQSMAAAGALDLAHYDGTMREEFKATEKRLKDKGMPEAIMKRHKEFTRHYQDNYEATIANLQNLSLAMLDDAVEKHRKNTVAHLDKAHPARKKIELDPSNLPYKPAKPTKQLPRADKDSYINTARMKHPLLVASSGSLAGLLVGDGRLALAQSTSSNKNTPPTNADLVETLEVQFTPLIKEAAEDLEYKPNKIYEFVRNYIDFVPTYGSLRGAHNTLMTGRGNAFDQASLLIALLRASGIHARYEYGTIEVPIDTVMNMAGGFTDPKAALDALTLGGIPAVGLAKDGKIVSVRLEHVWVKAWIDMMPSMGAVHKAGDTWVALDPSFKQYKHQSEADFSAVVPFDEAGYWAAVTSKAIINTTYGSLTGMDYTLGQPMLDDYTAALDAYIQTNHPNMPYEGFVQYGRVIARAFPLIPGSRPYKVVAVGWQSPDLPSDLRPSMELTVETGLYDDLGGTAIHYSAPLVELAEKRLTLSFAPATQYDRNYLRSITPKPHADGSPIDTSELPKVFESYLINLVPELKVGGVVVGTGSQITMGNPATITVKLRGPTTGTTMTSTTALAGEFHALALDTMAQHEDFGLDLTMDYADLLGRIEGGQYPTKDDFYGGILYLAARSYFDQFDRYAMGLARTLGVKSERMPSFGIAQTSLDVKELYGVPYQAEAEGMYLDIRHSEFAAIALDGKAEKAKDFQLSAGLYGSALEHALPESMFVLPEDNAEGISAVKILGVANSQKIPIYTLNSGNANAALPRIQGGIQESLRNALNAGLEVIAPESGVNIGGWSGTGYIATDPATGAGGFIISGGRYGGFLATYGLYHIECGSILFDEDPIAGLNMILAGVWKIERSINVWTDALTEAGKTSLNIGSNFIPYEKIFASAFLALGTSYYSRWQAFEGAALRAAGVTKNTARLATPAGNVMPDGVKGAKVLDGFITQLNEMVEVKCWPYVYNTGNLKKMINYAADNGKKITIYVPKGSAVSQGLKDAINGFGKIEYLAM